MATQADEQGTTNATPPLFSVPRAPDLVFEWAAIIPLAIYLISYGYSRRLVGRTALAESLNVGFFPKLGALEHIARLIEEGSDYLDRACSVSEFRREVWDVNWGSRFPCANGSATDILIAHALRAAPPPVSATATMHVRDFGCGEKKGKQKALAQFTRPQVLHVIKCARTAPARAVYASVRAKHKRLLNCLYNLLVIGIFIGAACVACLFGLYGTMAASLISAAFQAIRASIVVHPPDSYLLDNERGNISACMLVADHQNASSWFLFCGDRGVVDGVLNKNMIFSIESRFGRLSTICTVALLRLLATLQLLVMTFVACQKGWDGIGLLVFVVVARITEDVIQYERRLTKSWAKRHGVSFGARSFEFKGRTSMIGAIQIFKKDPTQSWMDIILQPAARRNLWLKKIDDGKDDYEEDPMWKELKDSDRSWVRFNIATSRAAAKIVESELAKLPSPVAGTV